MAVLARVWASTVLTITAQDPVIDQVRHELAAGAKRSHWMWFVFPQIAGLGRSPTAQFYAIRGREEGEAFARHALLGLRLRECTEAMLGWAGKRSAESVLGSIDALKLRSSMTLFDACAGAPAPFAQALDAFYAGVRDAATLERL